MKYMRLFTVAQALHQRAVRQNLRKLSAVGMSMAISALTISVTHSQAHMATVVNPPNKIFVPDNDSSVTKVVNDSLIQSISTILEWLSQGLQTLLRFGMLWLYFLPPMVASPMLILQAEGINDWWWVLFRHSICNAGPTFIKFAQVTSSAKQFRRFFVISRPSR